MRHYIGKKHGVLDRYVKETLAEVMPICQFFAFLWWVFPRKDFGDPPSPPPLEIAQNSPGPVIGRDDFDFFFKFIKPRSL